MGFFDVVWHLLGFGAVPVLLGVLSASAAKLLWRRELKARPWWRLALTASAASLGAAFGGLVLIGKDGAMLTYLAMVLICAFTLWWPLRRP